MRGPVFATLAGALLVVSGGARAQEGSPQDQADAQAQVEQPADESGAEAPPQAAEAPAPQAQPGIGEADLRVNQEVNLAPEEMVEQATKMVQAMREALARAMEVLAKARESKDIVRLNCVNEKLTPMKGIMKIAEDSLIALQEHVATGNLQGARYEYSKISISHQKVKTLLVQAINCIGAEAVYSGETEVNVEVDPDVAGGDPYFGDRRILVDPTQEAVEREPDEQTVGEDTPPTDRPPPASPYR